MDLDGQKKEKYPIPDAASERVKDADEHFKHSDYRADGIGYFFFFRLHEIYKFVVEFLFLCIYNNTIWVCYKIIFYRF